MKRKPRGDAKLKTLAPKNQEKIIEWLETGTQAKARRQVKAVFEIDTSSAALSEFYSWWHVSKHLEQAASMTDEIKEALQALPNLHLEEEQLGEAMQTIFEMEAAKAKDFEAFYNLRKLRLKEKDQAIKERRLVLLEKKASQAEEAEKVTRSEMTPEEKEAHYKQIFGLK